MTYSEHIQANRQHEREVYARLSPEEKAQRWQRRQQYLHAQFRDMDFRWLEVVHACGNCGQAPHARSWPSFYRCNGCRLVFCLDKRSHLVPTEEEKVCVLGTALL